MPLSKREDKRIHNRLPVAREGLLFITAWSAITSVFLYFGFLLLAIFSGVMSLFTIYFFRDPNRETQVHEKTVLTPADGKILGIQHLQNNANPLGKPAIKVSIFMSIFNVHVNRIPAAGRILKIIYHPGKFFSANMDKASEQNENNSIILETSDGREIAFVQIAGLIARRIVCWITEGAEVKAGQRFGLIRFGSRLDIYLPDDTKLLIQTKNKVKAGKTILGYLS